MRIIRTGITRTVVLAGGHAIKVPSLRGHLTGDARGRLSGFIHGILANQSEATWSRFDAWQGQIAPVRHSWLLGLINVYPRCQSLGIADDDAGRATLPTLDPDPGDVKVDNYGLLDGRIVRVDYAM